MLAQFKKDIEKGLTASPKQLSSKYFYDNVGSELFQNIMKMPEYYITNCEKELFETKKAQMVSAFNVDKTKPFELIELGAGDGTKTIILLDYLISEHYNFTYIPIDISLSALEGLVQFLKQKLPSLNIKPKQGDYFSTLSELKTSKQQKIILFIGSNLGNLVDVEAQGFIQQISEALYTNDKLLLGLDLIKSKDIILPAYNDKQGITKAFNLNLLTRINRDLNADFDITQFKHRPSYTENEGVAKSYLVSTQKQSVTIQDLEKTIFFEKGEKIHTEISRKYNDTILGDIIATTDFQIIEKLTDSKNYFADYILHKQ